MRILVVGSGGREHALAWKLAREAQVFAAPGNPGIAQVAECFSIDALDFEGLAELALRISADLVVFGPEDPLIRGAADRLAEAGLTVLGPGQLGARLEGSKAYAKELMQRAGVPTAEHRSFSDVVPCLEYIRSRFDAGVQVAVKASGPALGKGVVVCDSLPEAEEAAREMLVGGRFGEAGSTVVVEDRLRGREFSLIALCSGREFLTLPLVQDYKRAGTGDVGPNTGGMGSYSPLEWVTDSLRREAEQSIVAPVLHELAADGTPYRGFLFAGIMAVDGKPYCLEYNVRLGDPETETLVMRIGEGLAEAIRAAAVGVPLPPLEHRPDHALTVIVASEGYPERPQTGRPLEIGPMPEGVTVFHCGTKRGANGELVASGGRVLAVTARADSGPAARNLAYQGVAQVRLEGMRFRTDIGLSGSEIRT